MSQYLQKQEQHMPTPFVSFQSRLRPAAFEALEQLASSFGCSLTKYAEYDFLNRKENMLKRMNAEETARFLSKRMGFEETKVIRRRPMPPVLELGELPAAVATEPAAPRPDTANGAAPTPAQPPVPPSDGPVRWGQGFIAFSAFDEDSAA